MKKYKILIVDDIFINRVLLTEIITEIGFEYEEAGNGREALEIIQEQDFDLVLMDIEMPVMNGFETTRYIRHNLPEPKNKIPVVAITAHDPNAFFEEYVDVGFTELITKPYTVDKIARILNSLNLE